MCGIVGYIGDKDAQKVLLDGLERLEYRGYDSSGIAVFHKERIETVKSKGRLLTLRQKLEGTNLLSHCGIGHTRWATHGAPSDANSHPHGTEQIMLVHNGIIENYQTIRDRLIKKGYHFKTETDSEVIAVLLDSYYNGNPITAIHSTIEKLQGSYALGILFRDFPNQIFAVRKDSPLVVGIGRNESFIASDIPALIPYTRDYYIIEKDEIAILKEKEVTFLDLDGEPIKKEIKTASWDIESAQRGGFPHFMLKEINEQPTVIRKTLSVHLSEGLPHFSHEALSQDFLMNLEQIHIIGCGTAMHAGLVGKNIIEQLIRIPVEVDLASEFRYRNPIIKENALAIFISQSGETADTLAALRLAKERGVKTLALVNVVGSSIAREADSVIYTLAGPEISVASTKAYTVQLTTLLLFCLYLANLKGALPESTIQNICAAAQQLPDLLEVFLSDTDQIQHCAAQLQYAKDLFFIGRGIDYAVAREGSLKLKEISYIHSDAYAAGELKHGAISLITQNTPVVALATQQKLLAKTLNNVKEVKARGAVTLVICCDDMQIEKDAADFMIQLPKMDPLLLPIISAITLQLFAYYTAVLRGCDVDKPRNLAKSVTVE